MEEKEKLAVHLVNTDRNRKLLEGLYEQAIGNMEQADIRLERLDDILDVIYIDMDDQEIDSCDAIQMYVLHNQVYRYGAAYILTEKGRNLLKKSFQGDVYILPSSIHELICIPASEDLDREELLRMVKEINRKEVAEEDFLTDNVYLFRREEGVVEIAA